jgi:hypothetical protein
MYHWHLTTCSFPRFQEYLSFLFCAHLFSDFIFFLIPTMGIPPKLHMVILSLSLSLSLCIYIHKHIYMYMYICMYVCICIYVCIDIHATIIYFIHSLPWAPLWNPIFWILHSNVPCSLKKIITCHLSHHLIVIPLSYNHLPEILNHF